MTKLRLPALFSDHAVLQRHQALPVWGWADSGELLVVTLAGQRRETEAQSDGTWRVTFEPLSAGGPHTLEVHGANGHSRMVRDLLVGEVWLCSGQSNMDWPSSQSGFGTETLANGIPDLRLFMVPRIPQAAPQTDMESQWTTATPATLAPFSGVGVAFASELLAHVGCPVGLIHTAWGGTLAEAWTSVPALEANPFCRPITDHWRAAQTAAIRPDSAEGRALMAAWEANAFYQDPGISVEAAGWMAAELDDAAWPQMLLPCTWESTGLDIDGAVWFRHTVELPPTARGQDVVLRLGAIDDFDTTWFNGEKIGGIGKETPSPHVALRVYTIPARLIRAGRNVIAVRVFDQLGAGGIYSGPLRMETLAGLTLVRLEGHWRFKVELALEPKRSTPPQPFIEPHHCPGSLFNGMVAPLVPFALQGAIWYQGESNAGRAEQYRHLLTTMISDWRAQWGREFPFGIVQLNAWQPRQTSPGESAWAELREAQSQVAATLPHTWRCVGIDTGESDDIHPRNKTLIGYRLALLARHHVYSERSLMAESPTFAGYTIDGAVMRIRFSQALGLTAVGGNPLPGFAIAGADRKWKWARACIENETVVVSNPEVPAPVAVRYGWADFPTVALVNAAGLPADAFRTDDWPLVTAGVRI